MRRYVDVNGDDFWINLKEIICIHQFDLNKMERYKVVFGPGPHHYFIVTEKTAQAILEDFRIFSRSGYDWMYES